MCRYTYLNNINRRLAGKCTDGNGCPDRNSFLNKQVQFIRLVVCRHRCCTIQVKKDRTVTPVELMYMLIGFTALSYCK